VLKTFCFLLLKASTQVNPRIFFLILVFYLAHFDLLVTDGLRLKPDPNPNLNLRKIISDPYVTLLNMSLTIF
jgi:hypothetical protein